MGFIIDRCNRAQDFLDKIKSSIDFTGPVLLRVFLAPIFILAGMNKLANIESVAQWFEWLGIPAPELMAYVAGMTELFGGIFLLLGFAVRWIVIPLMFTMIVAAVTAHWENGWHVLPETQLTVPWEWEKDKITEAAKRKERAKDILKEHANYDWLTEYGSITILKNGIEFVATYFIMLFALFLLGGGRYFSIDYWLAVRFRKKSPGDTTTQVSPG